MNSRSSKKLGVKAEVNWLNVSRTGTSAGGHISLHRFHHSSRAAPLERPSASCAAIGNYCSGGHTVTPPLRPVKTSQGAFSTPGWGQGSPQHTPSSHLSGSAGRSAALLLLLPPSVSQHSAGTRRTGTVLKPAATPTWLQLLWREAYRDSSPANSRTTCIHIPERTGTAESTGLGDQESEFSERSGSTCNLLLIILWWNVLCRCKVLSWS